jgi:cytosine/adenosine deaminase-related metal-dependent hydrolase
MATDTGKDHWRVGYACCAGATSPTRRGFLTGAAALGAAAGSGFLPTFTSASAQSAVAPRGGEFVIRGGYIITMNRAAGDIPAGDVHVRNGAIIEVAPSIAAPGAETIDAQGMIVMPGFIETHSHCWNALLKNMRRPGVEYFPLKEAFGKYHTPIDYYRAVRLFMTDALNAGITTVINYAHNTQSPAHVDAEIRAMMESGLRGRYAYSGPDPYPNDKTIDFDDVLRVKRTFFSRPDNLIDLGYGLRPSTPLSAPLTAYPQEFRFAVDNGLPIILHSGSRPGVMNPAKLQAEGFSKNMIFVHSLMFDQKDREVMAETGTSNSFSLYNDLRNQLRSELREQILDMVRLGVNVCLSHDATSLNPTSMFDQMRLAWHIATGVPGTPLEKMRLTQTQCLEMGTINGAKAMGIANKTGLLESGKRADIILLRATDINMLPFHDGHSAVLHSANTSNVDTVIVDGKVLKFGGRILSVNVDDVRREAMESFYLLRERAGGQWAPKPWEKRPA